MMNTKPTRGFVTLTVTLIVIVMVILVSLMTGRILIGDKRISANELRYREALANAEAGIDAAMADTASGGIAALPVSDGLSTFPSSISGTTVSRRITTLTIPSSAGNNTLRLIDFTSTGLSQGTSEGVATILQQTLFVRVVPGAPDAPLTVAGGLNVSGNFMVVANPNGGGRGVPLSVWTDQNVDLTNGSGTTCGQQEWADSTCNTNTYSEKGNKQSDILDNDPNFPTDLLRYVFGLPGDSANIDKTMETLEGRAVAVLPNCSSLSSSSTGLYIIDGNCNPAGTIGSQAAPVVLLIRNGNITMNGNMVIYGLVFSYDSAPGSAPNYDFKMTGGATVYGAVVSNHQVGNSNGTYNAVYDAAALSNIQNTAPFNTLVRVPGSWRDW